MQRKTQSRSNRERTESTRHALIQAARALFVSKGYADTSTPEIASAAGITRGALYHHFADKRDLFRAVLEQEADAVARHIVSGAPASLSARQALQSGSLAYLQAMTAPGRTRLLLIEGPAVLGSGEMQAMDEAHAARTLHEGLLAALTESGTAAMPVAALATLLSASFDRAALAIDAGADATQYRQAMLTIIERIVG